MVGVDEARHDERAAEVEPLIGFRLGAAACRRDDPVLDEHPAVLVLRAGVVHHDDMGVSEQPLHACSGTSSKRSTSTSPWSVSLRLGITDSARKAMVWNGD